MFQEDEDYACREKEDHQVRVGGDLLEECYSRTIRNHVVSSELQKRDHGGLPLDSSFKPLEQGQQVLAENKEGPGRVLSIPETSQRRRRRRYVILVCC